MKGFFDLVCNVPCSKYGSKSGRGNTTNYPTHSGIRNNKLDQHAIKRLNTTSLRNLPYLLTFFIAEISATVGPLLFFLFFSLSSLIFSRGARQRDCADLKGVPLLSFLFSHTGSGDQMKFRPPLTKRHGAKVELPRPGAQRRGLYPSIACWSNMVVFLPITPFGPPIPRAIISENQPVKVPLSWLNPSFLTRKSASKMLLTPCPTAGKPLPE